MHPQISEMRGSSLQPPQTPGSECGKWGKSTIVENGGRSVGSQTAWVSTAESNASNRTRGTNGTEKRSHSDGGDLESQCERLSWAVSSSGEGGDAERESERARGRDV
eukprot:1096398-Rhodomonas_salina.1